MQDTQPLPVIFPWQTRRPTLRDIRRACGLSQQQLSISAGVRLCRIDWMERAVETSLSDILKVLMILSRTANCWYHIEDIQGLRIKPESETSIPDIPASDLRKSIYATVANRGDNASRKR
jgi:predicted transcriptional regulator